MTRVRVTRFASDFWLALRQLLAAVAGWLFGYPLTFLVRRDSGLAVVIGRRGPVFADNSKHFFVRATEWAQKGERVIFLTSEIRLAGEISLAGGEAVVHPTWRSLLLVLQCGRLVVDMADWFDFGVYQLAHGAQKIQLWHGVPLKHIELDLFRDRLGELPWGVRQLLTLQKALLGRYPVYDVVVATSQAFIDEAFASSFAAKEFFATGYPRNDVLLRTPESGSVGDRLAWINVERAVLNAITAAHAEGRKVALYVPTFRRGMDSPFEGPIDLERWSDFATAHHLLIVIKLHPFMHGRYRFEQYPGLLEYAPLGDIYPLMAKCDLLITDYSSIYLDYLLLDRPIVFFAYDLAQYEAKDRALYFPYDSMTPGGKCRTQAELERALASIIARGWQDDFAATRAKVRQFTHDHVDGDASRRLLERLRSSDQPVANER